MNIIKKYIFKYSCFLIIHFITTNKNKNIFQLVFTENIPLKTVIYLYAYIILESNFAYEVSHCYGVHYVIHRERNYCSIIILHEKWIMNH